MTPASSASIQHDELTGLPLRRAFNDAAYAALSARGTSESVSLLVIDVDHFKLINDTYGHLQGDTALRGIARLLRDIAPAGAFVGRFAGDEFVMLLPDTRLDDALEVAEHIRVAAHAVPVALGRTVPVALTLSIGVAAVAAAGVTVDALFAAADGALYDAKRLGRDTVAHPDTAARGATPRPHLDTFMARDGERRRLAELLGRAASGRPQVVSIVGEAGVGKSSLARALGNEVRLVGGSLVAGRCADSETRAPYWPWAAAIGAVRALRVVPDRPWNELARLLPSAGIPAAVAGDARLALFEEVSEFIRLASTSRPFVLVLDDMQWADGPSWDLLEYVVARLDHERLLLCLTVREEDADRDVLMRRARLSRDERFHELRIGRLSQPELARWMCKSYQEEMPDALVSHVFARSEGNPFFAVQILGSLMDGGQLAWHDPHWVWRGAQGALVPTAVRDLLHRRLAKLSPDATRILSAAAVIGRSIDLDIAVAAGIASEDQLLDAIDEGIAAHVLEVSTHDGGDRATFTHGLLVDMLHHRIQPRRLRRLSEQVEQVLERWRPVRDGPPARQEPGVSPRARAPDRSVRP